jgi:hypothetical protein
MRFNVVEEKIVCFVSSRYEFSIKTYVFNSVLKNIMIKF